jgi:hypothetical protein
VLRRAANRCSLTSAALTFVGTIAAGGQPNRSALPHVSATALPGRYRVAAGRGSSAV